MRGIRSVFRERRRSCLWWGRETESSKTSPRSKRSTSGSSRRQSRPDRTELESSGRFRASNTLIYPLNTEREELLHSQTSLRTRPVSKPEPSWTFLTSKTQTCSSTKLSQSSASKTKASSKQTRWAFLPSLQPHSLRKWNLKPSSICRKEMNRKSQSETSFRTLEKSWSPRSQ